MLTLPSKIRATPSDERMVASAVRTTEAIRRCRMKGAQLVEALDEVTSPHRKIDGFDDEDSVVTTLEAARKQAASTANRR